VEDRQLIDEVLAAVARQDWATVTRCVHPYVHWTVGKSSSVVAQRPGDACDIAARDRRTQLVGAA
jgi:ketosteroid isomerase-like protein